MLMFAPKIAKRSMKPATSDSTLLRAPPALQRHVGRESDSLSAHAAPAVSWDFSRIPVAGALHRKLAVGEANDPLEHEADAVADRVLSSTGTAGSVSGAANESGLKRKCSACEEEDAMLRPMANGKAQVSARTAPPIVREVLRSAGQPLSAASQKYFAPRFGRDLSQVRIHDDLSAGRSAQAVNALAYTVGQDIAFAPGQYSPDTSSGRRLLAHELAHVMQNGTGRDSTAVRRKEGDQAAQQSAGGGVKISVQSNCDGGDARALALAIAKAQRMLGGALDWFRNSSPENDIRLNSLLKARFDSDSDPTRNAVHGRLARVSSILEEAGKGNVKLPCVDAKDKNCTQNHWYAYVHPGQGYQINICPEYFRMNPEEQVWGIIHETCHLAGAHGDSYIFSFGEMDNAACYGEVAVKGSPLENADSYVNFVWCLLKPGSVVSTPTANTKK